MKQSTETENWSPVYVASAGQASRALLVEAQGVMSSAKHRANPSFNRTRLRRSTAGHHFILARRRHSVACRLTQTLGRATESGPVARKCLHAPFAQGDRYEEHVDAICTYRFLHRWSVTLTTSILAKEYECAVPDPIGDPTLSPGLGYDGDAYQDIVWTEITRTPGAVEFSMELAAPIPEAPRLRTPNGLFLWMWGMSTPPVHSQATLCLQA